MSSLFSAIKIKEILSIINVRLFVHLKSTINAKIICPSDCP